MTSEQEDEKAVWTKKFVKKAEEWKEMVRQTEKVKEEWKIVCSETEKRMKEGRWK